MAGNPFFSWSLTLGRRNGYLKCQETNNILMVWWKCLHWIFYFYFPETFLLTEKRNAIFFFHLDIINYLFLTLAFSLAVLSFHLPWQNINQVANTYSHSLLPGVDSLFLCFIHLFYQYAWLFYQYRFWSFLHCFFFFLLSRSCRSTSQSRGSTQGQGR